MLIFALKIAFNKIQIINEYYSLLISSNWTTGILIFSSSLIGMFMLFSKNMFFRKLICMEIAAIFYENLILFSPRASSGWIISFILILIFIEGFTRPIYLKKRGK